MDYLSSHDASTPPLACPGRNTIKDVEADSGLWRRSSGQEWKGQKFRVQRSRGAFHPVLTGLVVLCHQLMLEILSPVSESGSGHASIHTGEGSLSIYVLVLRVRGLYQKLQSHMHINYLPKRRMDITEKSKYPLKIATNHMLILKCFEYTYYL